MKIKCIIIDDEPLARKGLTEYVQEIEFLELAGDYENAMKATDALLNQSIDLMFLDIQMPRITGLEFLKSLKNPPLVIFTTAYPQYAVEGFNVNAVDYLLKPFSFDRFWKAVIKARTLIEKGTAETNSTDDKSDFFFIKTDNKIIRIRYDEILYIEALQNYVAIHTATKKYITYLTFKSVEDHLPFSRFIKIHKSYIIAPDRIDAIEGNQVRIGNVSLPISRSNHDEVMEKLLKGKFLKR